MWMYVKEKGKSCFFSSCQKYLHHCKVTAGMSRLFLHPMMLCMQDTSLNWKKQLGTRGMLTDIARIFTSTAQFISQSRQKWWLRLKVTLVCTWKLWHNLLIFCLGINLSFMKSLFHSLKPFTEVKSLRARIYVSLPLFPSTEAIVLFLH